MKSKPISIPLSQNPFKLLDDDTPNQSPDMTGDYFENYDKRKIENSFGSSFKTNKINNIIEMSPTFSNIIKLQDKINKHKSKEFNPINTLHHEVEMCNISNFDNLKFNSSWDIWFHSDPDDWSINSYDKLWNIETFDDFYNFFYRFDLIEEAKMINLYMFRQNILPTWEDVANSKGACLSIKVNDVNSGYYLFNQLCGYLVTESLIKQSKHESHYLQNNKFNYNGIINGISLNLKKNNVMYSTQSLIIKIWMSDSRFAREIYQKNLLNNDIIKIINFQKCSIIYQAITPNN